MDVPASDRCVPAVSGFGLTRIDQCERLTAPTPFRYPFLKNAGRDQKLAGLLWSALVNDTDHRVVCVHDRPHGNLLRRS